jgi:erythronate-4-phosphate dehydrogenase
MVKLVVDDKIPYISDFFTHCDDIVALPGEMITQETLRNADLLLTRTVTKVNRALLQNTAVRFVGTATTGMDHIDEAWLTKQSIILANAAGANAQAVAQYIHCCFSALNTQDKLTNKKVVGIVGCGRIGRLVAAFFQSHGFEVICCDPLLTEQLHFDFVSLETLVGESDIISIHTPLTKTGAHPTFHLFNAEQIHRMKTNAVLLNTARGEVIDQSALLSADKMTLCFDVWENEPAISLALLDQTFIGTPHIAGYSEQAKYRATEMIYEKAAAFFGWPKHNKAHHPISSSRSYDPLEHTKQFRSAFSGCKPEAISRIFIEQRGGYQLR